MNSRLDAVRARTRTLPRRRVLLIVDRMPGTLRDLYAATHGSFMSELIEIAGGDCVGAPAPWGYLKLSLEDLVDLSPDVVIDFVHGAKTRLGEDPKVVWADLRELPAVRLGHIYPVENDFLPHASQFVADTAELFARLLHPEVFH